LAEDIWATIIIEAALAKMLNLPKPHNRKAE